jgi:hypothetical protein
MKSPGFSAEASLGASLGRSRYTRSGEIESDRVVAAQFDLGSLWSGGSRGILRITSDCPPGQRLTYVEGKSQTKYCDVPAPTRDPVTGMIVWSVQSIPCGTEYVPPHWECQWAFTTFG